MKEIHAMHAWDAYGGKKQAHIGLGLSPCALGLSPLHKGAQSQA